MKTFQDRIFAELEKPVSAAVCEAVIQYSCGNVGTILVYRKHPAFGAGPLQLLARAYFEIQAGTSKIAFNGAPTMQPGDYPEFVFYFEVHDDAKINAMLARWVQIVQGGQRTGRLVEPTRGKASEYVAEAPGTRAAREQSQAGINR